jgi:hypothetical protein
MNSILDFNISAPNYKTLATGILGAVPMISSFIPYLIGNKTSIFELAGLNVSTY